MSEEIIGKLREVEVILTKGASTVEACPRIVASEQTSTGGTKNMGA